MRELIKIEKREIGKNKVNAVDGKELHKFIGSKQQFGNWITKRISKYGFSQDVDFVSFNKLIKAESHGGMSKEYYLSVDMAKELAMVENNGKGREARRYFIECEKALIKPALPASRDQVMARGIIAAQEVIAEQTKALEDAKPKIDFHDSVMASTRNFKVGEAAKLIASDTGKSFGRNTMMELLRRLKWIMKNTNEPYQSIIDRGYMTMRMDCVGKVGFKKVVKTPLITPKGLERLAPKIKGSLLSEAVL
jgi:anti-repressor protein